MSSEITFTDDDMKKWSPDKFAELVGTIWHFTKIEHIKDDVPLGLRRSYSLHCDGFDDLRLFPISGNYYILSNISCCFDRIISDTRMFLQFIHFADDSNKVMIRWSIEIKDLAFVRYLHEPSIGILKEVKIHKYLDSNIQLLISGSDIYRKMYATFMKYKSRIEANIGKTLHPDIIMKILNYTPINTVGLKYDINDPLPGKRARIGID